MHCGLWNMDHTSWITRATFFEIAVYGMLKVLVTSIKAKFSTLT